MLEVHEHATDDSCEIIQNTVSQCRLHAFILHVFILWLIFLCTVFKRAENIV